MTKEQYEKISAEQHTINKCELLLKTFKEFKCSASGSQNSEIAKLSREKLLELIKEL